VGRDFWPTQLATIGIPNIAWKERQYERHIGIPNFLNLPLALGMKVVLTGLK
jgi:hypothetical protein